MIKRIDAQLAQQIVDTVKDVCGQNINFIEPSGMILASTDKKRIDTFHEIGQKAAMTRTAIEVGADDDFSGTQKGINVPIRYNQELLAVIGITGIPDEVRKFAYLAERITTLLIREKELGSLSRNQADKKQFIIDSLIRKETVNHDYLMECLTSFHIDIKSQKRMFLIQVNPRYNPTNLSFIEQKIEQLFEKLHLSLYTFHYPNEYLVVMEACSLEMFSPSFKKFAANHSELLQIGIGKTCSIYQLADSYHSARIALTSLTDKNENYALFDDLTLEIVLSNINENNREEFQRKTIQNLSADDIALLRTYFDENMSLAATSTRLFLHKNTVQYKLNHIYEKCGFNPRSFQDAVLLYLAIKM
ncbi:MAG: sugar diacid recognition domain-containing protein [Hespellia sp.]|nr:sugar diacid recognition domain-containing protein [Hespellia sp.]